MGLPSAVCVGEGRSIFHSRACAADRVFVTLRNVVMFLVLSSPYDKESQAYRPDL